MIGKWNYTGLGKVIYGHPESYQRAGIWFDEVGGVLEDWGCGCCAMRDYVKKCEYIGLDGSVNDYYERYPVDLANYISRVHCLLLRDVIDHNVEWEKVLANAVSSFTKRMVLVIFHDLGPETKVLFHHASPKFPGVPDLQFSLGDLFKHIEPYLRRIENIPADDNSPNNETMFYLEKKPEKTP